MKIEQVGADGDAEVLLTFDCEGTIGEVSQGKVSGGMVGVREPALCGGDGRVGHGA